MNWIEKMNMAIIYIEQNITDTLRVEDIAEIVDCSTYHFQRIFACMTGVSLSEYIRRRRMTLAVVDLKNNDMKIIDVALKYGYSSPTSFNRAFQSVHGIAPSLIKSEGVSVKSYSPLSFQVVIKGVESLNFRIETKKAFRVVGISIPLYGDFEGMTEPLKQIWEIANVNGTVQKLISLKDNTTAGLLEVMMPDENSESWRYLISVSTDAPIDDSLEEYIVNSYTWAIFSFGGKTIEETQELGQRVISEWLPTSGYEYDNGPDISVHAVENTQGTILEYWLPIKKAKKK
ncbi:AraC family transcriptional regulator [Listeria seeligeri]|uniref:AraC family transcriptional regulator n=1 Tax=Listeria seeligeri TaxID=1640 RepID=UPI001886CFE1|nr:AraC family transcriptional regulator [Listeria seeligeri]MBF2541763.1 AraC family transcriptional regulator [Listeria seeligeri]